MVRLKPDQPNQWVQACTYCRCYHWAQHSPCSKIHCQLYPRKTKGNTVLAVNITTIDIYLLYIANKMELFSFKSGIVVQVANHLKETGL